jgi:hypothetical protein
VRRTNSWRKARTAKEEHHQQLHAVRDELDRAWETLRQRADRRAKPAS